MTYTPFTSKDTAIFQIVPGGSFYLSYTSVASIEFSPRPRLHIRGVLPWRRDLLDIEDGCAFEILHTPCGPMDWHDDKNIIFRFNNCQIAERYIRNAVDCQGEHVLFVDVVLDCEIETPEWGER